MSRQFGQAVLPTGKEEVNPALRTDAPVPKWKIEEAQQREREQKAKDAYAAEVRAQREAEERKVQEEARAAEELLARGHVKVDSKNALRSKKHGNDEESRAVEQELANLDALDQMFKAVLK